MATVGVKGLTCSVHTKPDKNDITGIARWFNTNYTVIRQGCEQHQTLEQRQNSHGRHIDYAYSYPQQPKQKKSQENAR